MALRAEHVQIGETKQLPCFCVATRIQSSDSKMVHFTVRFAATADRCKNYPCGDHSDNGEAICAFGELVDEVPSAIAARLGL